jgi:AcrR family transcriptional regulator
MASKIKPRIAETAMKFFADRGYHGTTTRDIAKRAKVTEGSIYRLFETKDSLFKEVLSNALSQFLDPAQFLMIIYEGEKKEDIRSLLTGAILRWYSSLSTSAARVLTQAYFMDEWRDLAYGHFNKMMEIIATTLESHSKASGAKKIDFVNAGRTPILALLQFKITYASSYSKKQEAETATAIVQQWLRGALPS